MILVGGPRANEAVRGPLVDRGVLDLGGLTADAAYLLKSVDLEGRGCVVVAGRDETGTMCAAYELLERCRVACERAGRGAHAVAGQMIAYAGDGTERHLLFCFNENVSASIEAGRAFLEGLSER